MFFKVFLFFIKTRILTVLIFGVNIFYIYGV